MEVPQPRSSDQLLEHYCNKRGEIVGILGTDPKRIESLWGSILNRDTYCMYRQPGEAAHRSIRNAHLCNECRYLSRISDAIDSEVDVRAGKYAGTKLVLQQYPLPIPVYSVQRSDGWWKSFDSATHSIILSSMMEAIAARCGIPSPVRVQSGFVCGPHTYLVSLGGCEDFSADNSAELRSLLLQLLVYLHAYKTYEFSAYLDLSNLVVRPERVSYKYEGVPVEGSKRLFFRDLSNASFLQCKKSIRYAPLTQRSLSDHEASYELYRGRDGSNSYLKAKNMEVFENQRRGLVLLPSLDWYRILLEVYSDPKLGDVLRSDALLQQFWNSLWVEEELESAGKLFARSQPESALLGFLLNKSAIEQCVRIAATTM